MTTVFLLLLLLPVARAAEDLAEEAGMDGLRRAAGAYLDRYLDVDALSGEDFSAGARAVLEGEGEKLPGLLRQAAGSGVKLLAVAVCCGLAQSVRENLGGEGLDPARLAGAAAVCAIAAVDVHSLLELGRQALERMETFSAVLMPTVTALSAAAGSPTAAVARQGAALLFFDLLLALVDRLLLPLAYAYVAAVTAAAALGSDGLKRVAALVKWVCAGLLTGLLTLFILYLNFTGAVSGSADALAQKAAKTALSGMVPVVGSILSDAAGTVVAGAGVLKGAAGALGLLAVLCICLGPFLRLGCQYLVYKFAAALTAVAAPGPMAELVDAVGSAFALALGMVGSGGVILYVALVTSVKAVGG